MIIVIQAIFSVVCDINIGPSVVVVISHGHAKTPTLIRDSRSIGDIGKRAVMIIMEKHSVRSRLLPFQRGERRAVQ